MKKLELLVPGDADYEACLKRPTRSVNLPLDADTLEIIRSLKEFIETLASPHGRPAGLAANQVGIPLRIALIQIPEEASQRRQDVFDTWPLSVLINPSYEPILAEGRKKDWEGCYSVPGVMGENYRYFAIQYRAHILREGALVEVEAQARGFLARALQHEIDHLDGKLYTSLIEADCRLGEQEAMMAIRQAERASVH